MSSKNSFGKALCLDFDRYIFHCTTHTEFTFWGLDLMKFFIQDKTLREKTLQDCHTFVKTSSKSYSKLLQ